MLTNDTVILLVIARDEFNGDEIRAAARILSGHLGLVNLPYAGDWHGEVLKITDMDLYYDAIKIAKEEGVWFEHSGNVVVFEPVPLWEIRSLIGDDGLEKYINNPACFSGQSWSW